MAENTNNAPIRIDDQPYVGQINSEYRNSADITGRPISPTTGDKVALYDSAKDAEARSTIHTGVYGAADYELDADGNKVAVDRLGDHPAPPAPPAPPTP